MVLRKLWIFCLFSDNKFIWMIKSVILFLKMDGNSKNLNVMLTLGKINQLVSCPGFDQKGFVQIMQMAVYYSM